LERKIIRQKKIEFKFVFFILLFNYYFLFYFIILFYLIIFIYFIILFLFIFIYFYFFLIFVYLGSALNVDVWREILSLKTLAISPKENVEMWLKFASLARKSHRINLAGKMLTDILGGETFSSNSSLSTASPSQPSLLKSPSIGAFSTFQSSPVKNNNLAVLNVNQTKESLVVPIVKQHPKVTFVNIKHLWVKIPNK
jgi:hypothetical protein